ncbi:hypothetical protein EAO71_33810 [Streptomyces sp. ms191]|uniref:DUF6221 family protein n=1 Tax=Streptomyces sp. ms191 TaxID=1827978 RepID=UPI0011CE144D|nr:DUF6221 family protein [Streptomyces sp. ms191]TXS19591.1 hypothetical protein EAO71_33810 [Streptomyces sp. ms191]
MDLVEFLNARLDEDERVATAAHWDGHPDETCWSVYLGDQEWHERRMVVLDHEDNGVALVSDLATDEAGRAFGVAIAASESSDEDAIARHIARFDPQRIAAEVDAKRRILVEHRQDSLPNGIDLNECATCGGVNEAWPCLTLRLLALPYAQHPDYDESWRP